MSPFDQMITFLSVTDLTASRHFYEQVLDLDLVKDQGDCLIYRVVGDAFVGVCERPGSIVSEGSLVTLVTDDVDGWHDRLVAAGVPCDQSPTDNPRYPIRNAFYRDPDGHRLEIQRFNDPNWAG